MAQKKNSSDGKLILPLPSPDIILKVAPIMLGIMSVLMVVIAIVGGVSAQSSLSPSQLSTMMAAQTQEIENLQSQLESLSRKLEKMESDIAALSQVPDQSKVALQLSRLGGSITELQAKVSNFEQVILDDPLKALEMPLLRKDLDEVKESYQSDLLFTRQQIDQLYDLGKWSIGVMSTMALGILGLAISNVFKGRESQQLDD